jgi:putative transposase
MIVRRAFKYRLELTEEQQMLCERFAGARRWMFNYGLEQRQEFYDLTGGTLSYFDQNRYLTYLKEQEETQWLRDIHSQVLQQSLKDVSRAYENFFRRVKAGEKPGHPRFKKKGTRDRFRYPQGVKVEGNMVFLPRIGKVKFRKTRDIQGTVKETTIIQEGSHWYVSFSCEWEIQAPVVVPIAEEKAVGIDLGVAAFATLACGTKNVQVTVVNPRPLKRLLTKLQSLSRRLSKKVKGSKNYQKAKQKLSRLHAKIRNFRHNFVHQLSAEMIKTHDIFCIESLDISKLLQNNTRALARSISDAGWRIFLNCLKYKAEAQGKHVVEAGKYFPSTQLCSRCDHRQKMELSTREYHCANCGLDIGRDYNSAIRLKTAGMSVLNACGATNGLL